jgi:TolB protein
MTHMRLVSAAALAACATLALGAQAPPQQPPAQQPPTEVTIVIKGSSDLPPKYAVPDFIALSNDAETVAAAKVMGQVLWDDLNYEREFYLIPRDTYRSIPQPPSLDQVPLDRWRELGADGVIVGSVRKASTGIVVQVRLLEATTGKSALSKEYSGSIANPRLYAHTVADEIHLQQRALKGVARTRIAFTSDRDGERMKGPVGDRGISNIYYADYDGANHRRVTVTRSLDIAPAWSPDGKAIAYTSYRSGFPDIIVQHIYEGRYTKPTAGTAEKQNYLAAWSPDGSKLAFMSNRDGNNEIYIVNRDGSGMRRLTNHPSIDVTATWSPTGNQIAFTSDRSGTPQIYIMNTDGSGVQRITNESYCDRPTWSPAPFNEIAYTSRSGGGYDIRVYSFATGQVVQLTNGIGSNESPAFSPNGRHIAFTSTRAGREQVFTIARDGKDLRQITREGANRYPHWSNYPQ